MTTSTDHQDSAAMAATAVQCVTVDLGERTYPIHIGPGLLRQADHYIGPLVDGRHLVVIADQAVAGSHMTTLTASLSGLAARLDTITVASGEASKSIACFGQVMEQVLALNVDRKVMLIALGGGVIGDLVGYVAASLLRGVDFIQVPTTLLAQVDSSVGGKTGINARAGKNLIGAFHQPQAVLADTDTLATLPPREIRAGYAEVAKYGLLGDAEFFDWLDTNQGRILALDNAALTETVARCCLAKARIVAEDEKEGGRRALLNLGHTFGHAYEAEANYDGSVLHGEAVAAGMVDAYRLGVRLGTATQAELERVIDHLRRAGLPTTRAMLSNLLGEVSAEVLMRHMQKDKKVSDGAIVFIVPHGIGDARVDRDVDPAQAKAVLEAQNT
ncbi:MAG: 3-dehydroquinate synthase [Alphaproteobacteria bacterium]|nr:3-dehydroquinate synthase [Alphaproteobacteria bacterium]